MPEKVNRNQIRFYMPFMVALAAAIGLIAGYKIDFSNDYSLIKLEKQAQLIITRDGRIEEILRFIETNYVDSLDQDEIAIDAITHILRQLDPHSNYITAEELEDHNEKMEGKYRGIGVETLELNDTFYIARVIEDTPAEKGGIKVGDAIIAMNDEDLTGVNSSFSILRKHFRNKEKPLLKLVLMPLGDTISKTVNLESQEIIVPSANTSFLINDDIAYIKLIRFSGNTYEQFMKSVEKLIGDKPSMHLIIDLRDNPGGYLPEAVNILSQLFQDKNKLLCYTEGLNRKRSDYYSTGKTFYNIEKIVVLINEYSASGSEIVAGAIQDWDRGIIIGQPSYGKGLVQEIFPLKNGGALRLTVAKYYTPSGRLIQKSYNNIAKTFEADTNEFKTKLLERKVQGGGGIMPDVFVKSSFNDYCYNYREYIDYYIMHKMIQTASNKLEEDDLSVKEMNEFVYFYFNEDISGLEKDCEADLGQYIWGNYLRISVGMDAYEHHFISNDAYIDEAMLFFKNEKTTLASLSVEN